MANPVIGESQNGAGVLGTSQAADGVFGSSERGRGVVGVAKVAAGVEGNSSSADGVFGASETGRGVVGVGKGAAGVEGNSASGDGVFGLSETGRGVVGVAKSATGVEGNSRSGSGIFGSSETGIGVQAKGGRLAALFEGDVEVTGDIRLTNADCAEDFDVDCVENVEPGTVMVIDPEGKLRPSGFAYDTRVVGVISGAGGYKPGIVLDKQPAQGNRSAIALLGKVYCKVDADLAPVQVGDLLTTSETPGHAMKAHDSTRAFGSVIGKALRSLPKGQGLIPVLIALQ